MDIACPQFVLFNRIHSNVKGENEDRRGAFSTSFNTNLPCFQSYWIDDSFVDTGSPSGNCLFSFSDCFIAD